ncbi:Serine/threonine-protein kinase [Forsythia ovata]|uniref:Serine/threonine-protein kinase n=1 Tax=Forsythia ovata TaxID=205694 RepID=A0ABD1VKM2_9LAMI
MEEYFRGYHLSVHPWTGCSRCSLYTSARTNTSGRLLLSSFQQEYSVSATQKACSLAYYCLSQNPKARPLMSDVVETFEPLQGSGGVNEVSSSSSLTPTLMCGGSPFVSGRIPDYRMHHRFGGTIGSAVGCRSSNPNCSPGGSVACRVR